MNLIKNLNKKQIAKIDNHNKKVIAKIVINEHNKRMIEFFNSEKIETSTRNAKWSQK